MMGPATSSAIAVSASSTVAMPRLVVVLMVVRLLTTVCIHLLRSSPGAPGKGGVRPEPAGPTPRPGAAVGRDVRAARPGPTALETGTPTDDDDLDIGGGTGG